MTFLSVFKSYVYIVLSAEHECIKLGFIKSGNTLVISFECIAIYVINYLAVLDQTLIILSSPPDRK
jgi:hypothetical protein